MGKKADYGRGHPKFLEYVESIVTHPTYAGMPDVRTDDNVVQWESPSNRTGGKFKDTHKKRLDWWRKKAAEVGMPSEGPHWISKVAKTIHPTKQKPCKACGMILDIRYAYPRQPFIERLKQLDSVDDSFPIDPNEHICDLITRMVEQFGNRVFTDLPKLLNTGANRAPALPAELAPWIDWVRKEYIPKEPRTLGPGVMSNAPDRLDGFHSFNQCCRGIKDTGRSAENLRSYTTDRRVFEYWVDGNWVAADHLMGLIRSDKKLKAEPCRNDHQGPCSADHVGPISLGFAHRPDFQLLCHSCNSGKNNRMYASDVTHLIAAQARGERIASWYCESLWDQCKGLVTGEETAQRLSKLLRDNRHTVMYILGDVARAGHYAFLATFLGLERASQEPRFENLRVENHLTVYDALTLKPRATKYVGEQKARRLRVAFTALREYVGKENRNAYLVTDETIKARVSAALAALATAPAEVKSLDEEIRLAATAETPQEETLRALAERVPTSVTEPTAFKTARAELSGAMGFVATRLAAMWTAERYVREVVEDEIPVEDDEESPDEADSE